MKRRKRYGFLGTVLALFLALSGQAIAVPGVDWEMVNPPPTGNQITAVTWSGAQFVAVGLSGTIVTSPDGLSWAVQRSGITNDLNAVIWNGTQFIAVGDVGTIVTSPDGLTWTVQVSGTTNELIAVIWNGTQFVAVGRDGTIVTSPDGLTWAVQGAGTPNWLGAVTCDLGALANGATATVTIVVIPTAAGAISNSASVTGNEADPNAVNNSATATTLITRTPPVFLFFSLLSLPAF